MYEIIGGLVPAKQKLSATKSDSSIRGIAFFLRTKILDNFSVTLSISKIELFHAGFSIAEDDDGWTEKPVLPDIAGLL